MRTTLRIGRGLHITGGGGVFAAAVSLMLLRGALMFVALCVAVCIGIGVVCAIWAISKQEARPKARRVLANRALAMAASTNAIGNCGRHGAPPVIGLYVLGGEFFVGSHPRKLKALEQLYPDRLHDLVCAGVFPDRASAGKAQRALTRSGFSASELKTMSAHMP